MNHSYRLIIFVAPMIKIAITDDHPIIVQGLELLFASRPEMKVIKTFSNGKELMDWLPENPVDVLLLDIYLEDFNGLELCKQISDQFPETAIIAISGQDEGIVISQMLQNGALGYVLKNAESHEIIEAVEKVYRGERFLCQRTKEILAKSDKSFSEIPKITRREKDVLMLVSQGLTTSKIADKLFISHHTVESHRKNLMEKFHVKSMASVIGRVSDLGLI